VICAAKRDLEAGEELDGGGGSSVYAQVERVEVARRESLLPVALAENVSLRRPLRKDQYVGWADVEVSETAFWRGCAGCRT
jgi:predicted homoserine dehydrogenase-like protein